ncbi:MAG: hypothetical protein H8E98_04465 [Bacteroidetes bacterium]|nr:hypothetical protein [Bacteroidota bacterium]
MSISSFVVIILIVISIMGVAYAVGCKLANWFKEAEKEAEKYQKINIY